MDAPWSGIGSVAAAVIGASALVAVNIYAKRKDAREKAAQEIRVKKTELYEELIGLIFNQLLASRQGKKPMQSSEVIKALAKLMPRFVVWASPSVIAHWNQIKTSSDSKSSIDTMAIWEKLMRLIREDLGHNDDLLKKYDLTRLFVNDLDEHLDDPQS
jgi:ribosomal protein L29